MKEFLAAVLLAAMALVIPGCRGEEPDTTTTPAGAMEDQWTVKGKVVSVAEKGVTIDHQNIPDLMPAMTMGFAVRDPSILQGVQEGDAVEFTLVRNAEGLHITRIRKINPAELEPEKKPQR